MKNKLVILILTSIMLCSCATTKSTDDEKLKSKLVGSWSGSEKDNQIQGVTKYWIQKRDKNGTFVLLFTSVENCEVESHIEKGKWWIKDGVFYEKFKESGDTDSYSIEIFDNDNLKFKAKKLSMEFADKEYEFFEHREE